MEGPVRSMSRMPTDLPDRERDSASWVVMEDLPTPPFPERTCGGSELYNSIGRGAREGWFLRGGEALTRMMCLTLSSDILV